jgi:hypothetical protein
VRGDVVFGGGDKTAVELHAYGERVDSASTDGPFALTWDSSRAGPGPHVLVVRARDVAGRTGEASVEVRVRRTYDVREFGARGDGASDDTEAVRKALDAAGRDPAAEPSSRSAILLEPAIYRDVRIRGNTVQDSGVGRYSIRAHPRPGSRRVVIDAEAAGLAREVDLSAVRD